MRHPFFDDGPGFVERDDFYRRGPIWEEGFERGFGPDWDGRGCGFDGRGCWDRRHHGRRCHHPHCGWRR